MLIDDVVIDFCRKNVKVTDFVLRSEESANKKKMKRHYLRKEKEREFIKKANDVFQRQVEIP